MSHTEHRRTITDLEGLLDVVKPECWVAPDNGAIVEA